MSFSQRIIKVDHHVFERTPLPKGSGEILRTIELRLSPEDVLQRLGAPPWRSQLVESASTILAVVRDVLQPMAVFRWLDISWKEPETARLDLDDSDRCVLLAMGCGAQFLQKARKVLVGVYTVGRELEELTEKASREKRFFDGYLYDIVGLGVLDALGAAVGSVAENYAADRGWGVGPLLSPGSVRGWKMDDQAALCSMLPLQMIDAGIQDNGVLTPFKSISFIIGTGPDYRAVKVANTCKVCSRKDDCPMHRYS